jgi:hypothetical protein
MNSLTIFDIPFVLVSVLPFFGAGSLAWAGWMLGQRIKFDFKLGSKSTLDRFVQKGQSPVKKQNTIIGSQEHRIRVAFSKMNIDTTGNEEYYMTLATLVAGTAGMIILMIIGLPFFTALVVFLAGRVFIVGWAVWFLLFNKKESRTADETTNALS